MGLVQKMFAKENIPVPPQLTFESLAKSFMALAGERYPSTDKVLQQADKLGADSIIARIIIITQFRDAIRAVAKDQIYRSIEHRDELLAVIVETLESLEDQLEDLIKQQEDLEEENQG